MATVTIHHVAERAGVSIKTVSRVLNKEPNVKPATRDKVLAAAETLRYRPSVSARSLAGARSYLIALFSDNPSSNYIADIQRGAVSRCREDGYHLVLEPLDSAAPTATDLIRNTVATLRAHGAILTPPVSDRLSVLQALEETGTPFVRIAPDKEPDRAARVRIDDRQAAYEMTVHLLELGHRHIGFIIGHPDHGASHLRHEGFLQAMADHGLAVRDEHVAQGFFSFNSGYACADALLEADVRPTAIFASNDDMAVGVLAAAHRRRLSVPADLSVAGFDDTPAAMTSVPPLTTVRQPIFQMAAAAAEMLIRGEWDPADPGPAPSRLLPFEIVVRESTAPPRG
ncbi:LacI family DNA-binding transcriptional regulator [Phenylobacterium sp.]|uniref:LacI family DNA-binding transcriptional regulator n=1 Tax=Phenylobacterium sp. TaxID=1871053 RepID=UPI0035AFD802